MKSPSTRQIGAFYRSAQTRGARGRVGQGRARPFEHSLCKARARQTSAEAGSADVVEANSAALRTRPLGRSQTRRAAAVFTR